MERTNTHHLDTNILNEINLKAGNGPVTLNPMHSELRKKRSASRSLTILKGSLTRWQPFWFIRVSSLKNAGVHPSFVWISVLAYYLKTNGKKVFCLTKQVSKKKNNEILRSHLKIKIFQTLRNGWQGTALDSNSQAVVSQPNIGQGPHVCESKKPRVNRYRQIIPMCRIVGEIVEKRLQKGNEIASMSVLIHNTGVSSSFF